MHPEDREIQKLEERIEQLNAELAQKKYREGSVCGYCSHSGTLLLVRIVTLEIEVKRLESIILEECEIPQIVLAFQTLLADGVPLMPGMTVWARYEWEDGAISDRSFVVERIQCIDGNVLFWQGGGSTFKPCDCFATMAALVESHNET